MCHVLVLCDAHGVDACDSCCCTSVHTRVTVHVEAVQMSKLLYVTSLPVLKGLPQMSGLCWFSAHDHDAELSFDSYQLRHHDSDWMDHLAHVTSLCDDMLQGG